MINWTHGLAELRAALTKREALGLRYQRMARKRMTKLIVKAEREFFGNQMPD
jgi:hypothetical protein